MKLLTILARDYSWIHLSIGLFGNTCFFVGSILFLSPSLQPVGTWLFILGAGGMLIGQIGHTVIQHEQVRRMKASGRASGEASQDHEH